MQAKVQQPALPALPTWTLARINQLNVRTSAKMNLNTTFSLSLFFLVRLPTQKNMVIFWTPLTKLYVHINSNIKGGGYTGNVSEMQTFSQYFPPHLYLSGKISADLETGGAKIDWISGACGNRGKNKFEEKNAHAYKFPGTSGAGWKYSLGRWKLTAGELINQPRTGAAAAELPNQTRKASKCNFAA